MNYKDILSLLDAAPFEPFRIHLSDGKTHEIKHRDFLFVSPTRLMVITTSKKSDRLFERTEFVSLLHVVRVEILQRKAA